jgi:hypothetical protein
MIAAIEARKVKAEKRVKQINEAKKKLKSQL